MVQNTRTIELHPRVWVTKNFSMVTRHVSPQLMLDNRCRRQCFVFSSTTGDSPPRSYYVIQTHMDIYHASCITDSICYNRICSHWFSDCSHVLVTVYFLFCSTFSLDIRASMWFTLPSEYIHGHVSPSFLFYLVLRLKTVWMFGSHSDITTGWQKGVATACLIHHCKALNKNP